MALVTAFRDCEQLPSAYALHAWPEQKLMPPGLLLNKNAANYVTKLSTWVRKVFHVNGSSNQPPGYDIQRRADNTIFSINNLLSSG